MRSDVFSSDLAYKMLRKVGDAPIIYDEYEALRTEEELLKAVQNMGYMAATVDGRVEYKKKKIKVYYDVKAGEPYIVETLKYDIPDTLILSYLRKDSANLLLKEGMIFDVNILDNERQRIANYLLRNGGDESGLNVFRYQPIPISL